MVTNMDLIPLQPLPEPPAVQTLARAELSHVNAALARRIDEHRIRFAAFWRDYGHTPDDILEAMGPTAIIWLMAANESVEHVARLAAIVGKTVGDFLDAEDRVPPRAFIVGDAPGYAVTLAPPAEGQDAWGRPLVPPPDEEVAP